MSKTSSNYKTAIIFGAGASVPPLTSQQGLVRELLDNKQIPVYGPQKGICDIPSQDY